MAKMRNLLEFNPNEMKVFLDSFDTVVTDCDGVLWLTNIPIEKSLETLKKLQCLGKRIIFVSNNSTMSLEEYCEKFRRLGFPATADQIAIPSRVIAWYLEKLKFDGKAYVVGTKTMRRVLQTEGIETVEPDPDHLEELPDKIVEQFRSEPDVKAVIVDLDVNVNWLKISKSIKYLRDEEVLYIAGALDRKIPIRKNLSVLGVAPFVEIISREANRKPVHCAKPSGIMKNYILEKFALANASRCLFIGDSFENDMKFAELCGFSKLWVASGVDKIDSLVPHQNGSSSENNLSVPDYYLPSLGHLLNMLDT